MRFWFLMIFTMVLSVAYADEFVVRSFTVAQTDVSALRYQRHDANDKVCAIIKVRTDLRGLAFDAGKNLVGDIQIKSGEYWLYVSPGESRITIYKDGFITKHYLLPLAVESSKVYVLEVTNKQMAAAATGSLILVTEPPGAVVKIRELSGLEFTTPDTLQNYPAFPYSVTITKYRHATLDTILTVHPTETITHHITLIPTWGDVLIDVEPEDAEVFIDNEYVATGNQNFRGDSRGIDVGQHTISIRRENYYVQEQDVTVIPGQITSLQFTLQPMLGVLKVETPPGAALYIDGKMAGRVPYTDTLLTGDYQLTLSAEGFLEKTMAIRITENNTTYVNEALQQSRLVKITSQPSQAEIYLDGDFVGTTPATILLGYGDNTLQLRKAKYHDLQENVQVGKDTDVAHFTLEADVLAVLFTSSPGGAQLYVDDKSQGFTSTQVDLPYGKYRVKIKKQGYFTRRRNLTVVAPGQKVHFHLQNTSHYRAGAIYGMGAWGGEFTWARSSVGVGVGLFVPSVQKFTPEVQHKNVSVLDYSDLTLGTPVGRESNADSADFFLSFKVHLFLQKIPHLSFVFGTAVGKVYRTDVYLAHKTYQNIYFGEDIPKGDYFSVAHRGKWKFTPIAGLSLRLLRFFYINGEVWFNTTEGTQLYTGGGICFPVK
ncbi:MAG: PEGA domain-containing protein [Bacteroidales bacterium]|nr:PEGA domain-containing protein [Bacteroidales bacterium]